MLNFPYCDYCDDMRFWPIFAKIFVFADIFAKIFVVAQIFKIRIILAKLLVKTKFRENEFLEILHFRENGKKHLRFNPTVSATMLKSSETKDMTDL